MSHHFNPAAYERLINKLNDDFGPLMMEGLKDDLVQEIQMNANGRLYFKQSNGKFFKGMISEEQRFAIIYDVAGLNQTVITSEHAKLEASLPKHGIYQGERFTAHIPPASPIGPGFTLRKKPLQLYTLSDYLEMGCLTHEYATLLRTLVKNHQNIVVCGAPGSGKSTFTNALIAEVVAQNADERLIILEDRPELQCTAGNSEFFLTTENITMQHLLKHAMRMSPDRILVGEVRGAEALDLLKAWNTGCPGGIATIHANGPMETLQRLGDCAMESGLINPPTSLIKHTVDAVVFVTSKNDRPGFIQQILTREELFQ